MFERYHGWHIVGKEERVRIYKHPNFDSTFIIDD